MVPFDYIRPKTLKEACAALEEHLDDAQLLAGGHTLLPLLKMRMAATDILIDIQDLSELRRIEITEDMISIGALTRHVDLQKSVELFRDWPVIRQAAGQIADLQVRNRGTIGGSLSAADPSADWPAVALLLSAQITLQSTDGERTVKAEDYFAGMMETVRGPSEILTKITLPRNSNNMKAHYHKFRHPASGYAVASAAVGVTMSGNKIDHVRIAISGISDHAYLAEKSTKILMNEIPSQSLIEEAVQYITHDQTVMSDQFADTAYRAQLAKTMCYRALVACLADQ